MKRLFSIVSVCLLSLCVCGQTLSSTYLDYIAKYKDLAIEQQRKHRIPAAVTMAQGLLESAAGKSELATQANNHFGIKCTSDWPGRTYHYDDDRSNECFRRYADVVGSYEDHSLFLLRKRYESLFSLPIGDYRNWAYGLKACGYATDPKYPEKLIRIIEQYDLQQLTFDTVLIASGAVTAQDTLWDSTVADTAIAFADQGELEDYASPPMEKLSMFHNHRSGYRNGVRYIVAEPGESFASLAAFLNMYERTLRRYNDALDMRELEPGDMVYIYAKKHRADRKHPSCYIRPGDTAWGLAQKYGIKLKCLYSINGIPYGTPLTTYQRLDLR